MAAEFLEPDLGNIYTPPPDDTLFFVVVQVSKRKYAVAQYDGSCIGTNSTDRARCPQFVIVTEPMSYQKAYDRAISYRNQKLSAIGR